MKSKNHNFTQPCSIPAIPEYKCQGTLAQHTPSQWTQSLTAVFHTSWGHQNLPGKNPSPPSSNPAQIMESAIASSPYASLHLWSLVTGTSTYTNSQHQHQFMLRQTFCRIILRYPPSCRLPHPMTVHRVPSLYSSPWKGRERSPT